MSNPTTPFSWQMPTATDLVTDLPADFEVFGQAVATSMADLLGGTSGQILAKNSNTDMDFVWVANDVGDITAVTAGTGISGGGTSGTVTVTNSMATAIDAKGDLIAGTGADAFSRLAVGTNGQAVIADSTAGTGLAYGNKGFTLLSTTALSGATVSVTSIPQTYTELLIITYNQTNDTADGKVTIGLNSSTTFAYISGTDGATAGTVVGTAIQNAANKARANNIQTMAVKIDRYASTITQKPIEVYGYYTQSAGAGTPFNYGGMAYNLGAITSVQVSNSGGNQSGGTVEIWGLN